MTREGSPPPRRERDWTPGAIPPRIAILKSHMSPDSKSLTTPAAPATPPAPAAAPGTPAWGRPDDPERQPRLNPTKDRAPGVLAPPAVRVVRAGVAGHALGV